MSLLTILRLKRSYPLLERYRSGSAVDLLRDVGVHGERFCEIVHMIEYCAADVNRTGDTQLTSQRAGT